jgi:hypothetical protein
MATGTVSEAGQPLIAKTFAFSTFCTNYIYVLEIQLFLQRAVNRAQEHSRIVPTFEPPERWPLLVERTPIEDLGYHSELISQMLLCRMVDSFVTYISELLTIIFAVRPEMLRSQEQVTVKYVLEHSTMEEFVRDVIERRVHSLSYKGLRDLNAYVSRMFDLSLFESVTTAERAVRLVEMRNLLAHNNGVVNKIFLSRVPESTDTCGTRLTVGANNMHDHLTFLYTAAGNVDKRAIDKFNLPTTYR